MSTPAGPYLKRPLRFLEMWLHRDWKIKVYGIRLGGERPDDALILAAREIADGILPEPAIAENRYGVGFLMIHQGEGYNQINIDWWEDRNELRHHYFATEFEDSHKFINKTGTGHAFCVWDLRIIGFERDAWVNYVLDNPNGPDIEAYLRATLDVVA